MSRRALLIPIALVSLCRCATQPVSLDPAWVSQPTRTIDSGYIVYVGRGEDETLERAQFKAEASALQDLANECSFLPKGTRIEDRFSRKELGFHHAFTKIGLTFEECEGAKRAVAPDQIRALANTELTARAKMFQDMLLPPKPDTIAVADDSRGNFVEYHGGEGDAAGWATDETLDRTAALESVATADDLLIQRQRIVAAKTDVILAPATRFTPGAAETTTFLRVVGAASEGVRRFETSNPEVRTWRRGWSSLPSATRAAAPVLPTLRPHAPATAPSLPAVAPPTVEVHTTSAPSSPPPRAERATARRSPASRRAVRRTAPPAKRAPKKR